MSVGQSAPEYIRSISPYVPGKPVSELAREMGWEAAAILKLASNENPLGASPMAQAALAAAAADLSRYPDGSGYALKQALSCKYGLAADCFVLGNGSSELLELAARTFLSVGDEGVYAQHAFALYALTIQAVGGLGVEVPTRFFSHDLAAMSDAIGPKTKIVFLANPNNPTGTFLSGELLEAFLAQVPGHVMVVLDEAYHEYLPVDQQYSALAWIKRFPNLLVARTFSKIYGLAGLRVGYMMGDPAVVDLINRVREPFNVNSLALAAAEAALGDDAFVRQSHAANRAGMQQIVQGLHALNLVHIPSSGNFLAFRVGDAGRVNRHLLAQGIIVRPIANYGMPEWLRVTIGREVDNIRFLEALSGALKGQ
jgi:histidinol-phosphate aminotransferase